MLKKSGAAFVVGGAVRDRLLSRPYTDIDVIVPENPKAVADKIAVSTGGTAFALDEERGIQRVTMKDGSTLDIAQQQGGSLESDLDRRDFTINALAVPTELWDTPRAGVQRSSTGTMVKNICSKKNHRCLRGDLERRPAAFAARISCRSRQNRIPDLPKETLSQIRLHKSKIKKPAPERRRDELLRLFDTPDAHRLLVLMDECAFLDEIFPHAKRLRSTAVKHYGKGGVLKHTLWTACICFEDILRDRTWFHGLNEKIKTYLDEPIAGAFAPRCIASGV